MDADNREELAKSLEYAARCFYGEQYGDEPLEYEMILFASRFAACQLTGYKTEEEERSECYRCGGGGCDECRNTGFRA